MRPYKSMAGQGRPVCKYGASCYRKNKEHLRQYSHPPNRDEEKVAEDWNRHTLTFIITFCSFRLRWLEKRSVIEFVRVVLILLLLRRVGLLGALLQMISLVKKLLQDVRLWRRKRRRRRRRRGRLRGVLLGGSFSLTCRTISTSFGSFVALSAPPILIVSVLSLNGPASHVVFPSHWLAVALKDTLGLELTGPYDVIAGRLRGIPTEKCLLHSRYFYDPPEFLTVLKGEAEKGFHIGYFRCIVQAVSYAAVIN